MNTKFDWSVRVTRIHFQIIHQDIFENSKRLSPGFLANIMISLIMLYGSCYTIWNYDTQTAFNAALTFLGTTQVQMWTCFT